MCIFAEAQMVTDIEKNDTCIFIINHSSYICIELWRERIQGRRQLLLEGRRLKPSQISNRNHLYVLDYEPINAIIYGISVHTPNL